MMLIAPTEPADGGDSALHLSGHRLDPLAGGNRQNDPGAPDQVPGHDLTFGYLVCDHPCLKIGQGANFAHYLCPGPLGVAGLSAAQFLRGKNPLGYALAVRMNRGALSKVDLQLACERKIVQSNLDEVRKYLLFDSVRTYARLKPAEQREYRQKLELSQNQAVKEVVMTWSEKIAAKAQREGEKRGEKRGEKKALLLSISKCWSGRFGPLPEDVSARLSTVREPSRLEGVLDAVLGARDQADALSRIQQLCAA